MRDQRATIVQGRPPTAEHWAQLRSAPLFRHLADEIVAQATRQATVASFPDDGIVFCQGEIPTHLHLILEGEVGLTGTEANAENTVVEILSRGAAFIEAAALTDEPYLMGAKCLRPTTLLMMPAAQLREDIGCFPDLARALVSSLSAHFRVMVAEVKDLKLKSASQRLGMYLLGLTARRDGADRVVLPHSKTVIAAKIGIRRETFSRALASLAEVGVTGKGHRVVIADIGRLHAYCTGWTDGGQQKKSPRPDASANGRNTEDGTP